MLPATGNGERRTERWVKFGATMAIAIVGPLVGVLWNQDHRITVNEERTKIYSAERLKLDEEYLSLLRRMAEQHDYLARLMEYQSGAVVVAPQRRPDRGSAVPKFGPGSTFDK